MDQNYEIVSVSGGKFHRPENTSFTSNGNAFRDARLMRCGRALVPLNFFETITDANRYTGNRLEAYICQQCERKISHLWRVRTRSAEKWQSRYRLRQPRYETDRTEGDHHHDQD